MGFVTPAIVTVAGVLSASAHVPPLFASVIVTTPPACVDVAEHEENAALSVIAGVPPMPKLPLKVTVRVLPVASAPDALVVKAVVQDATAPGAVVVAVNVTPVTLVAAIVTAAAAAGDVVVVSRLVETLNAAAGYVPAVGFVIPARVTVAGVLAASAQVPPLLANVTVTTLPTDAAVAEQSVNAALRVTVGVAGSVKFGWNVAVIVPPEASDPAVLVVNATVQLATAPGAVEDPAKVIVAGAVAVITGAPPAAGETAVVSALVATEKLVEGYVPTEGFVTPAMASVAGVLAVRAQVPPLFASVIVTTFATAAPVAEQLLNALPRVIAGVAVMPNAGWNVAVIVLPAARAPVALVVNAAVHVVVTPGAVSVPVYVTVVTAVAAIVTAAAGTTATVSLEVATANVAAP